MSKRFFSILLTASLVLGGAGVSSIALAGTASATTPPLPVANYVTHLYHNLLNRTPSTLELQYWEGIHNS